MDKLPAAVQAQVDEAERISGMLGQEEQPQTEPQDEAPAFETEQPEEPPQFQEPQSEQEQPQEPTTEPEQPKGKGRRFKKVDTDADSEQTFEQRYRSLAGMYNAEVPKLHTQIKEMRDQVQMLHKELEETRAAQVEQPEPEHTITDEDREAFGPDLVNLIEKAADAKAGQVLAQNRELTKELEMLKARLGDVSTKQQVSDQDRFITGLAQQVPNWEELNVDPGFLQWLQQTDPIYGLPRQVALNNAYESLDVNRVATIFNAYQGTQSQAPARPNPKEELQRHVAPSSSRASTQPQGTQNSRIFTSQQIQEFYDDWRRGNISDEQAQRIEAEIHAAAAEGRIR